MENKTFIVSCVVGDWDRYTACVFVTSNKDLADKYVAKANKMLKKWKEWYSQFNDEDGYFDIENNSITFRYARYNDLMDVCEFFVKEIEER